jgi:excisionase family DNA binding protein
MDTRSELRPILHSVEETANLIRISPHTVRAYVRSGLIKPTRIGTRVLVSAAEIDRIAVEGLRPSRG